MIKHLLILLSLLLTFSTILPAEAVELLRTGQTTIYAAGDDGDMRAGAPWPVPRFSDSRNGTISDNLTGLIWIRDANSLKNRDPGFDAVASAGDGEVTWQHALDYIKRLNVEKYLGHNDWRLPNLIELASLVHQGQSINSLWLSGEGFYSVEPDAYWSSSSNMLNPRMAWTVNIDAGPVGFIDKNNKGYVWPVRGGESFAAAILFKTGQSTCFDSAGASVSCTGSGQDGELRMGAAWPVPRISINGDQTVTDNLTGLIWARDANLMITRDLSFVPGVGNYNGAVTWQDALVYVSRLNGENYLGYSDWRLPNRNELASVVNYAEEDPAAWLGDQGIMNIQQDYWSSGTSAVNSANAWNVTQYGFVVERGKLDTLPGSYVWPVRGGLVTPTLTSTQAAKQSNSLAAQAAAAATLTVSTSSLPAGTVGTSYSQTLVATGGTTPYTWSKTSGSLPAGLTLSSAGVISGTPTTAATITFTVQVKDKSAKTANKSLSIVINAAQLSISTAALADGYLTTAYSQTLAATGGKTTYSWSITSGTLPAGLTLTASTGKISGTPTAPGTSSITVQVKDANNTTTTKALTITVYALPSISTTSLSAGTVGTAYSQTLSVTGGKASYSWSISSGTLPAGLSLAASTGVISGKPTTAGTSSVTFMVMDANGKTATKSLSIIINAAPLTITTSTLADGYLTTAYSQTLVATGGKTAYTWAITSGALPTGLTLATSTGVISGTPTAAGTGSITIQVKDSNNTTATKALAIAVYALPSITTASLPADGIGMAYSQTLTATGGKTAYTWSISSGALPAELTLAAATGVISGTPTTAATSSVTFKVTDANAKTATKALSITVNTAPLSITTTTLADGYLTTAYNQTLTASGGKTAYSLSITSGALPSGLSLNAASGAISGTPSASGSYRFTIQVKDAANATASKQITLSVYSLPSITTAGMMWGYVGLAYSQTLAATGGKAPYNWFFNFMPPGLSVNASSGLVSGIPGSGPGSWGSTGQLVDANGITAVKPLEFGVSTLPSITTGSLPDGLVSVGYSTTMTASGGRLPLTWSVSGGGLPTGLNLNAATGVIGGTPSASGTFSFTILISDLNNVTSTKSIAITVTSPVTIATTQLPDSYVGLGLAQTLIAAGGTAPYTWTVTGGSLPVGVSLGNDGTISGTPTVAGNNHFTVQATDANHATAARELNLNITSFASINGTVTDRDSGAPLQGVTVTLNLTGIASKNDNDRFYLCNTATFTAPDYAKVASNEGSRFSCSTPASNGQITTFKVRNPFGVVDPPIIKWTGTSVITDDEYLAQSFRPSRNGQLNKVMLAVPGVSYNWNAGEMINLQLRTALDGGAESLLAESEVTWVPTYTGVNYEREFLFPAPITLTAGQQYYLVIKGKYVNPPFFRHIYWGTGVAQAALPTFIRNNGIWTQADRTLMFRTYLEDLPDVTGPASGDFQDGGLSMVGNTDHHVAISVLNRTTGLWEYGGALTGSSEGDITSDGDYFSFSKGDSYLTIERSVNSAPSNYYDQNGWITVRIENLATLDSSLLTDQFNLTFNRTLTAVTDANGGYSFASLPDGSYTLSFNKTTYVTGTVGGTLSPGQTLNTSPSIALAPVISTPSHLPSGIIGKPYTQAMTATSAFPPYTWMIISGSLPAGLTLDGATGNISGTPTSLGTSSFTLQVKDSMNTPATKTFTMTITSAGLISGIVTDQATGAPISGVNVTLALTGITSNDPADRIYSCNNTPLLTSDYPVIAANDDIKFSCLSGGNANSMLFKVRNPSGTDSFTINWNGMGTSPNEYLSQSFRPTVNGNLTKVSFYLTAAYSGNSFAPITGEMFVHLKSKLGGDIGERLAESNSINIGTLAIGSGTWVDFTFPTPASISAGQEYFLEIQGHFEGGDNYWQNHFSEILWGDGTTVTNGTAYNRSFGLWTKLSSSLAFRTYLDSQPDVAVDLSIQATTNMLGSLDPVVNLYLINSTTGSLVGTSFDDITVHRTYKGYYVYSSADLTRSWSVGSGLDQYFDKNGWMTVQVQNDQVPWWFTPPLTSLVTDQFSLTFNRILTTVTDANGNYSFSGIPDSNYTVVFDKAPYSTGIVTGSLQSGQAVSINPVLTVNNAVHIVTNTLAVGSSGRSYTQAMAVGSGRAPYAWSIIGGQFPNGLTLDSSTGVISGRPTTAGDSIFIVKVQDANNKKAAKAFTIKITQTYVPARINVSPSEVAFGGVITGKTLASVVTVTNASTTGLAIGQVSRPSEPYQVTIDNCSGKTLAAAATCTMTIQFSPMHTGSYYEIIDIPSNDATYPNVSLFLSGDGIFSYLLPDTGKGDLVRNPIYFALNSENSATDWNTHLIWQRSGSPTAVTWADAGAYCRDLALDGYNDWRLPSFLELTTIVNYGATSPAIDAAVFPGTQADNYWTAFEGTGHINSQPEIYAGVVNFAYGEAHPQAKTNTAYVRCTRGDTLTNTLQTTGNAGADYPYTNGLISTDQSSGLVWAGNPITAGFDPYICDPLGNCTTLSASNACNVLTYAGTQNWRTPTIKELVTLSNQPCLQGSCFTQSATQSGRPDASDNLTNVYMYSPGTDIISTPPSTSHAVTCVRGGNRASQISGLTVSGIVANGAVIQWNTDQPTTAVVEYGETSAYGSNVTDSNMAVQHTTTLSGLKPATTYHFRITAANALGVAYSTDQTLTTLAFSVNSTGDTGNVALVEMVGVFDAKNPDGSDNDTPRQAIAKEYIRTHGDNFDFLVFVSTFDYALPESSAEGFYLPVRNDVQGINQPIFDYSAQFGSNSKLQGTIDMGNISQLAAAPFGPLLDTNVRTLNHELGHRFGSYVRFKNPDGSLNTSLLGKDSAHWSYLLDSQGSIMYGNGWKNNYDGTFTSVSARSAYSPLDLYLMGMIPKEQVPPMLLIDNPAIDKTQLPSLGATVTGTAKTVTIDDIIAAEGARIPDSTAAQKQFNVGFVLLSRAGDNTAAALQAIETMRSAWAGRLAEQTNGIGGISGVAPSVLVFIDSPAEVATITGPDVTVSGTVINTTGVETGVTVNGMPATVTGNRFIANHVPLQSGVNSITITATDTNGLTTAATRNVTSQAGNYIRISSNIESGTGPLTVNLRIDGSFVVTSPVVHVTGPGGAATLTPVSETEYTANFTSEGTYTITATATGSDGQTYTDSVTITVMSRYQLETLLKGKWEEMKQKIASGDISGAGSYFPVATRDRYQAVFNDPVIDIMSRLNEISDIKIYTIKNDMASGGAIKQEDDGKYSYPLDFIRDENGVWQIYGF